MAAKINAFCQYILSGSKFCEQTRPDRFSKLLFRAKIVDEQDDFVIMSICKTCQVWKLDLLILYFMYCPIMKRFGEKLRQLRQRDGISLRKLAALLGHASPSLVTSLERSERKPSAELVIKIADIFGVTTDQLLRDELNVE